MNIAMNIRTDRSSLLIVAVAALAVTARAAFAAPGAPPPRPGWYASTTIAPLPSPRYRAEVDRQLFDEFGHGGAGRNLYCEGPAIVRFQITPAGRVERARVIKQSLVALNARLIAVISNMRFPPYHQAGQAPPVTVTFRYGTWGLARPALVARTNCR